MARLVRATYISTCRDRWPGHAGHDEKDWPGGRFQSGSKCSSVPNPTFAISGKPKILRHGLGRSGLRGVERRRCSTLLTRGVLAILVDTVRRRMWVPMPYQQWRPACRWDGKKLTANVGTFHPPGAHNRNMRAGGIGRRTVFDRTDIIQSTVLTETKWHGRGGSSSCRPTRSWRRSR
jgi:hypothetical protein